MGKSTALAILVVFSFASSAYLGIAVLIGAFIYLIGSSAHESGKTGSYKQANTSRRTQKMFKERSEIDARYGGLMNERFNNPAYMKEMNAHKEKWAVPGTKAGNEVKEKTAKWKAGQRW